MKQTFEYDVLGNTQPAVNANKALDTSVKQLDKDSKKLKVSLDDANKSIESSLQKQEAKIKTLSGAINVLGGSVELVVGSLGLIGLDEKQLETFQKGALSAIAFADGAKRVFEGYKELTEARKIFSTITKAGTAVEVANTTAQVANTTATAAGATATVAATTATNAANVATKSLTATLLLNPYVLIAAAIVAAAGALYYFISASKEADTQLDSLLDKVESRGKINDMMISRQKESLGLGVQQLELEGKTLEAGELKVANAKIILGLAKKKEETELKGLADNYDLQVKNVEIAFEAFNNAKASQKVISESLLIESEKAKQIKKSKSEILKLEVAYLKVLGEARETEDNIASINNNVTQAQNDILTAEKELIKLKEDKTKKQQEADEKVAKEAVIQLEAQRQATLDLIDLYTELYPEMVTGGQFDFTNEVNKTNYELAQQILLVNDLDSAIALLSTDMGVLAEEESNVTHTFLSPEQLAIFKKLRDYRKSQLQLSLEDLKTTYDAELLLLQGHEEAQLQLTAKYEKDKKDLKIKNALEATVAILGATSQFFNALAQMNTQNYELQLLNAKGNEVAINAINKKSFESNKKLRLASAVVTTAESMLNGWNSASKLPTPYNYIVGSLLSALYAGIGATTIATISATQFGNSSSPSSQGGGFGAINIPGGGGTPTGPLPGMGGGRLSTPSTASNTVAPIRAYVLAGDVETGVQANIALNNRRRLAG